jgi:hypothetical protein
MPKERAASSRPAPQGSPPSNGRPKNRLLGALPDEVFRYMHGRITVRDREGLERASCECYPIIRAHFDRLRQ